MTLSEKYCGRCGHRWSSSVETPKRCPCCGTYHWKGEQRIYNCKVCGHTWFSRTTNIPARCPKCKTRSWMSGPHYVSSNCINMEDPEVKTIISSYNAGHGCTAIAIELSLPLSRIIRVIRIAVENDHPLRM